MIMKTSFEFLHLATITKEQRCSFEQDSSLTKVTYSFVVMLILQSLQFIWNMVVNWWHMLWLYRWWLFLYLLLLLYSPEREGRECRAEYSWASLALEHNHIFLPLLLDYSFGTCYNYHYFRQIFTRCRQ